MTRIKSFVLSISLVLFIYGCGQEKGVSSSTNSNHSPASQVVVCFQPSIAFLARQLLNDSPDVEVVLAGSSPISLQTPNSVPPSHYVVYSQESTTLLFKGWQDFLKETDKDVYLNSTGFPLESFFSLDNAKLLVDQLATDLSTAYPVAQDVIRKNQVAIEAELASNWYAPEQNASLSARLEKKRIVVDRESALPLIQQMGFTEATFASRESLDKIDQSTIDLLVKIDPRSFTEEQAKNFSKQEIPIIAFNSDDKVYLKISDLIAERKRLENLLTVAALSSK